MEFFEGIAAVPPGFGPSAVTVGKFDGVHLGHLGVFRQLCDRADADGLVPTVVTFDRNPLALLRPEAAPLPIVSRDQQLELLERAGVAVTVMLEFTPELAALPPEEFVRRVLADALHAQIVLAGSDFRFGDRGAGDVEALRGFGPRYGYSVVRLDDVLHGDRRISSTWVREALEAGRVREAAALLGRPHAIRSRVVRGEQRGRELGYPTANLDPAIEGMLPVDGVYAAWATVEGERSGAAVSIGNNPTFDGIPQHQVEAHLLDRSVDLYGKAIQLEFVEHVRPMQRFPAVDALIAQLQADEASIRAILGAAV
jgi:riboflavin kinase/FMN adenylyltransferase